VVNKTQVQLLSEAIFKQILLTFPGQTPNNYEGLTFKKAKHSIFYFEKLQTSSLIIRRFTKKS